MAAGMTGTIKARSDVVGRHRAPQSFRGSGRPPRGRDKGAGDLPLFRSSRTHQLRHTPAPRGLDVRPLDTAKSASKCVWHGGAVLPSGAIEVMAGERRD